MPLISVIVPVYKVEQYLSRCIDSILAQTFKDFELILVDDGSPDNCGKICDEYAEKDSCIHVIHQENGGLSAARNAGIDWVFKNSSCEFLAFVDSDDIITEKYLEKLFEATDNGVDVVACQMQVITEHEETAGNDEYTHTMPEIFSGKDAVFHLYKMDGKLSISACTKLYRKSLFSTIRFPEGKIHEDQAIVPILLYFARKVAVVNEAHYLYFVRNSSIMHENFSAKRFDDVDALQSCENFFTENKEFDIATMVNKRKAVINALYTLFSRKSGTYKTVPKQYKMSRLKALRTLEKNMSFDKFTWRLSQTYPHLIKPYSYWVKILKILKLYNDTME